MIEALQNEVDTNYEAFRRLLPELMFREADRWALMKNGECVDFYDTFRDAETAACALYEDGVFSVQHVTNTIVDFGWFSHVVR